MIKRKEKKHIMLRVILIIVSLFVLFILYSIFIGTKGLFVKEYMVSSNIPDSFDGLKIVHISDIHYNRTFKEKDLKKLVDRVNLINPDIIVLTGDLLDKKIEPSDSKGLLTKYLKQMNAKLGKYAISGNHDLKYDYYVDILKDSDFKDIDNTYELIYYKDYDPIIIAGLSSCFDDKNIDDKLEEYKKYIAKNDVKYRILLLHEPDTIDNLSERFDLILAGHSHNGQVRLPLIGATILPDGAKRYYEEHYTINNTELFISSGLGTSNLPLRFMNHPSINFYRINKKS